MDTTEQKMEVDAPVKEHTEFRESDQDGDKKITAAASVSSTCGVCEKNPSKYKCPRCYLPYCSVACNKIHRENHPPDPEPTQPASAAVPSELLLTTTGALPTRPGDDDDDSPYSVIHRSEKLQWLFRKYPRLPEQLLEIETAMREPTSERSRIPASLLKDLPPQNSGWDREKGIAQGKKALRRARGAEGEDGEAIREYSELVLYLMEEERRGKKA
ncbi:HIT zinc finger [Geosmithia morbida]|uniref:HIT zinc finger n=1 Tax=Geosmithia morbida TaxID=1094350 RepID=A0A9P5D186_9HYPO|nr:HIT zinc finger [Geosmithia morbida]KAF4123618.1 HIT zinc finger [Geosmithia morbida]